MINTVNLEQNIKRDDKRFFGLTTEILETSNRIHDAKLSGALKETELASELISIGKLFANQVKMNLKTELDVETYENDMATGKTPIGDYPHKNLDVAFSVVKQTNTDALLKAAELNKKTQMPDGYSKGLKMVS